MNLNLKNPLNTAHHNLTQTNIGVDSKSLCFRKIWSLNSLRNRNLCSAQFVSPFPLACLEHMLFIHGRNLNTVSGMNM